MGPGPFAAYRKAYEKAYGADEVGVTAGGREVLHAAGLVDVPV